MFPNEAEATPPRAKDQGRRDIRDRSPPNESSPTRTSISAPWPKPTFSNRPIADAAFSLPEGGVSEPIKTQFGSRARPCDQDHAGKRQAFRRRRRRTQEGDRGRPRARRRSDNMHDKIEDAAHLGQGLADAAKTVGLDVTTIDAVDATGHDKSGAEGQICPIATLFCRRLSPRISASTTIRCRRATVAMSGSRSPRSIRRTIGGSTRSRTGRQRTGTTTRSRARWRKAADLVKADRLRRDDRGRGRSGNSRSSMPTTSSVTAAATCRRRRRTDFQRPGRCGGLGRRTRPHTRRLQGARLRGAAARSRIGRDQDRRRQLKAAFGEDLVGAISRPSCRPKSVSPSTRRRSTGDRQQRRTAIETGS